jgi:hypothetical protein
VYLTLEMLKAIDASDQQAVSNHSVPINIYLMYEVVSDDLAIGLATTKAAAKGQAHQRDLLLAFNNTMIACLKDSTLSAQKLLAPYQNLANTISGFEQTLVPDDHYHMARHYVDYHPQSSLEGIEHSIWPRLIANIDSCVTLTRLIDPYLVGPIVRQGLIDRYAAVTSLLREPNMILPRRVAVSADAILVVPTLAYYIGILAETIHPIANFRTVVENGELHEGLYNAAVLVRLLNDLGTSLIIQPGTKEALLRWLQIKTKNYLGQQPTFGDLLLQGLDVFGPVLTRLHKDIAHGEFNTCLYNLTMLPASEALPIFEQRLGYLITLYQQTRNYLRSVLESMTNRLNNAAPSTLITHFVDFHESIYAYNYSSPAGDYTVALKEASNA